MNTLNHLLSCALIGLATSSFAQQGRIVVQHGGNVQVFSDLTEAIVAAPANADLYLSGGSFQVPGGFALDKTLHFIGAGTHPDTSAATGGTVLATGSSSYFRLTTGANGSTFHGIRFHVPGSGTCFGLGTGAGDQDVVSVEFHRCQFQQDVILGAAGVANSSSAFVECLFYGSVNGYDGSAQFTRCIFNQGGVTNFATGGLIVRNCTGLGTLISNSANAVVENGVFTRANAPFWQCNGMVIANNLLVSESLTSNMSGFAANNNILGVPVGSIFQLEDDNTYQYSDDLHLQATCPGVGAGTDGTDMGIYGTDSPYKEGAAPHTPHFQRVSFAGGTNAAGNLPVQVRVAAQAN